MLDFETQGQPTGRRERQKQARRQRIEAAARAVFGERGYDGATTREIAERADVSIGTLFAYAPDKRALLAMVFRDGLRAMTEQTFATLPAGAPFLDQLMHVLAPRYAFWGADPALARHAVRETIALSYDGTLPPEADLGARLVELVRAQQELVLLDRDVEAAIVARVVLDIYLSENRAWLAGERPDLAGGLRGLREALALALRGVTSSGASPRATSRGSRNPQTSGDPSTSSG
jgi:AcrR family transcriptional regulator